MRFILFYNKEALMTKLCREVWIEINFDAIKKFASNTPSYTKKEQNYGCRKSERL
jgi:hypothetical protein